MPAKVISDFDGRRWLWPLNRFLILENIAGFAVNYLTDSSEGRKACG